MYGAIGLVVFVAVLFVTTPWQVGVGATAGIVAALLAVRAQKQL